MEPSPGLVTNVKRPLSGTHEAWQLYNAATALMKEVEYCKLKIKELEKVINES